MRKASKFKDVCLYSALQHAKSFKVQRGFIYTEHYRVKLQKKENTKDIGIKGTVLLAMCEFCKPNPEPIGQSTNYIREEPLHFSVSIIMGPFFWEVT